MSNDDQWLWRDILKALREGRLNFLSQEKRDRLEAMAKEKIEDTQP